MSRFHFWEIPDDAATQPIRHSREVPPTSHSWEVPAIQLSQPSKPPGFSWDNAAQQPEASHEDRQAEAGIELAELLLQLHADGRLSAKHACLIAHWAAKAGAVGPVDDLGLPPGISPSGHYQWHLDRVAGLRRNKEELYELAVPGHKKLSVDRGVHKVKAVTPHERLHKEFVENLDTVAKIGQVQWPPSFIERRSNRTHGVILVDNKGHGNVESTGRIDFGGVYVSDVCLLCITLCLDMFFFVYIYIYTNI